MIDKGFRPCIDFTKQVLFQERKKEESSKNDNIEKKVVIMIKYLCAVRNIIIVRLYGSV